MNTKTMRVNRWGNSLGIRFPSELASFIGLKEKSLVEIKADGERLIITKLSDNDKQRPTIQELFELHPADFIQEDEIDWGEAVGEEAW
jgi:antitoxin MazE